MVSSPECAVRVHVGADTIGDTVTRRECSRLFAAAKHSRKEPDDRIGHHCRGKRSVRQDVVADRKGFVHQRFRDTFVDAFVVAADDNQMGFLREPARGRLVEAPSRRSHQHDMRVWRRHGLDRLEEGAGLHQHSRPAAVGAVVGGPARVAGEVSGIDRPDLRRAHGDRAFHHAFAGESVEHRRKERDDVDAHHGRTPRTWRPQPRPRPLPPLPRA